MSPSLHSPYTPPSTPQPSTLRYVASGTPARCNLTFFADNSRSEEILRVACRFSWLSDLIQQRVRGPRRNGGDAEETQPHVACADYCNGRAVSVNAAVLRLLEPREEMSKRVCDRAADHLSAFGIQHICFGAYSPDDDAVLSHLIIPLDEPLCITKHGALALGLIAWLGLHDVADPQSVLGPLRFIPELPTHAATNPRLHTQGSALRTAAFLRSDQQRMGVARGNNGAEQ